MWSSQNYQKLKSGNQKYTGGQVQGLSKTGQECKSRGERKGGRGLRDAASDIRREPRELKATSAQVVQGQDSQLHTECCYEPRGSFYIISFQECFSFDFSSTQGKHSISS